MEDRVYTDVNDYIQYLTPWAQMTFVPLTYFSSDGNDPLNIKVYGDAVWNRWIDSHYGDETIRDAWAGSLKTKPKSFAPAAYDASLKKKGTNFFSTFASFTADTAEWRASNTPFAEGATFPDIDRAASDTTGRPITLTPDGVGASGKLAHTSYVLLERPPGHDSPEALACRLNAAWREDGDRARRSDRRRGERHGAAVRQAASERRPGVITIENPGQYERLTAAVINADTSQRGFSRTLQDWVWKKDSQAINARVSADFTAPSVTRKSPRPGAHRVSTRTRVVVGFNDRMFPLSTKTVRLVSPGGHAVKAKVALTNKGKKSGTNSGADRIAITPRARLRPGTRYEVRLSRDLRDFGGNALPARALIWSFVTKR